MGGLTALTRRADVRGVVAASAGYAVLPAHDVSHFMRKCDAPRLPNLGIGKIVCCFGPNVANPRCDMGIGFDEPAGFWNMTVPTARRDAFAIAAVRRLQIVGISRQAGHAVAGRAKRFGRSMPIDFDRRHNRNGANQAADCEQPQDA